MSILELEKAEVKATPELTPKFYRVAEFLNLETADEDDDIYELIEGEVVAKPKSGISGKHGKVASKIDYYLQAHAGEGAAEKGLGEVYVGASTNLGQPEGSNYFVPDVCFVLEGRTPEDFPGAIPVAPDLVVEVNSPSDTEENIDSKIQAYLRAGVRLIWSVSPIRKFVIIYRASEPENPSFCNINGELDGGDVLPGFKLAVSKLFK